MKTFRTNSRLNKLIKSENINAINKTSNNLFDVDFLQLPLSYKNIVFNKYLETKDIIVNNGRFGSYVKFGDKYYLTNKKTFIKTWK